LTEVSPEVFDVFSVVVSSNPSSRNRPGGLDDLFSRSSTLPPGRDDASGLVERRQPSTTRSAPGDAEAAAPAIRPSCIESGLGGEDVR
jgi:hypothetical protein